MCSQKPRPPKMSAAAVEAFEQLLGRPELNGSWKEELEGGGTPLATEFAKYWKDQAIEPEVLAAIPHLVMKYPIEREVVPKEGVKHIEDVKAFKQSLKVSEEAKPLVEWGDILSKY
jgi:insulysin